MLFSGNNAQIPSGDAKSPRPEGAEAFESSDLEALGLALPRLEPTIRLVDDVRAAATANHPAIAMTRLQRLQGIANLHGRNACLTYLKLVEYLENPRGPYVRNAAKSILCGDVGGLEQEGQGLSILSRYLWTPNLEQQDDALAIRLVPGLMLHAIVEDQQLAFAPASLLIADPKRAAGWNDQRQVADQPEIEQAMMRADVRAGLQ